MVEIQAIKVLLAPGFSPSWIEDVWSVRQSIKRKPALLLQGLQGQGDGKPANGRRLISFLVGLHSVLSTTLPKNGDSFVAGVKQRCIGSFVRHR